MTEWQKAIKDMLGKLFDDQEDAITQLRRNLAEMVHSGMAAGLSQEEAVLYTMDIMELQGTSNLGVCTTPMRLIEGMLATEFPDSFGIEEEDDAG
jgi:hypothetical protein